MVSTNLGCPFFPRNYSKACFHGHSVGGTNPSLLEAMAAGSMIIAHENPFNRYILNDNALYFTTSEDITRHLNADNEWIKKKPEWTLNNKKLISENYQWDQITDQYENLFRRVLEKDQILK
jgi:glycosyltransferase involved in cell wall biosynthesis